VKENREKLGETDAKSAEEAIEEARRALNEGGLDRLNAAAEKLTKISHTMAETMYKSQQASAGSAAGAGAGAPGAAGHDSGGASGSSSGSAGSSGSGQGDVVDAEFVDVDDSKKPN
jgi:molecular chaperone DnaK